MRGVTGWAKTVRNRTQKVWGRTSPVRYGDGAGRAVAGGVSRAPSPRPARRRRADPRPGSGSGRGRPAGARDGRTRCLLDRPPRLRLRRAGCRAGGARRRHGCGAGPRARPPGARGRDGRRLRARLRLSGGAAGDGSGGPPRRRREVSRLRNAESAPAGPPAPAGGLLVRGRAGHLLLRRTHAGGAAGRTHRHTRPLRLQPGAFGLLRDVRDRRLRAGRRRRTPPGGETADRGGTRRLLRRVRQQPDARRPTARRGTARRTQAGGRRRHRRADRLHDRGGAPGADAVLVLVGQPDRRGGDQRVPAVRLAQRGPPRPHDESGLSPAGGCALFRVLPDARRAALAPPGAGRPRRRRRRSGGRRQHLVVRVGVRDTLARVALRTGRSRHAALCPISARALARRAGTPAGGHSTGRRRRRRGSRRGDGGAVLAARRLRPERRFPARAELDGRARARPRRLPRGDRRPPALAGPSAGLDAGAGGSGGRVTRGRDRRVGARGGGRRPVRPRPRRRLAPRARPGTRARPR